MSQYIIATDLDGTLLDHTTYKFHKAAPALEHCDKANIPVIFNTSKTFGETERLAKVLDNNHPFIIENGSALYVPKGYFAKELDSQVPRYDAGAYWLYKFGLNRSEILSRLTTFNSEHKFSFIGFSQMTTRELSRYTGLTLDQAAEAKERQFSEPLLWQDQPSRVERFAKHMQLFGINVIKGGRFVHLIGMVDKGKPLAYLKALYALNDCEKTLIALGDSDNDKAMLERADIAVVIQSPAHQNPVLDVHPRLIRSRYQGPVGWNDTILELLEA
ncbi:HAD-IIB family hydrolase [Thalassotalea maritima]|uniref:HAD-IIB family hydrolase n=1 Tax=Thalassotalea maritima TaxID=3242416 RepID=UPI0035298764